MTECTSTLSTNINHPLKTVPKHLSQLLLNCWSLWSLKEMVVKWKKIYS